MIENMLQKKGAVCYWHWSITGRHSDSSMAKRGGDRCYI